MTDYFGVTDYFIVTNDIIVTHYSIYFRYRWLHNYRLLHSYRWFHSYRLQRFSVKMNGCNSKVICKNSSATVSKILFNIAILIIHYKLYSNGGFNITMGLGCESNLSLPWTPGVCENGKPIRVYQNGEGASENSTLVAHKSSGLVSDTVTLLQCNSQSHWIVCCHAEWSL